LKASVTAFKSMDRDSTQAQTDCRECCFGVDLLVSISHLIFNTIKKSRLVEMLDTYVIIRSRCPARSWTLD